MSSSTSGFGSIDGSFSEDGLLLCIQDDSEDTFASLAFAVGLTMQPERDVRSFTVSASSTFRPS